MNLVRYIENIFAIKINFNMIFIVIQSIQGGISTSHIGCAGVPCDVFSRRGLRRQTFIQMVAEASCQFTGRFVIAT